MKKIIQTSGKRKRAVARATLREGKGIIRINSLKLEAYSPEIAKMMIQEPLMLAAELSKKVDIRVDVFGGGWHSQAEAARLAIARALVEFSGSKKLKTDFIAYDRNLLVQDSRVNEASKPNDSKPRASRQKSYR
ncbi:MAG TPA: 30S ribosomal protein S9 [Candidatus Nanoarchaeia archaeon]|nr:30S ribosomal protein S9 [Candidatus Nanoarchaeia archaeon]